MDLVKMLGCSDTAAMGDIYISKIWPWDMQSGLRSADSHCLALSIPQEPVQ